MNAGFIIIFLLVFGGLLLFTLKAEEIIEKYHYVGDILFLVAIVAATAYVITAHVVTRFWQ